MQIGSSLYNKFKLLRGEIEPTNLYTAPNLKIWITPISDTLVSLSQSKAKAFFFFFFYFCGAHWNQPVTTLMLAEPVS